MKYLRKYNESLETIQDLFGDIKEILSSSFIDCGFDVDIIPQHNTNTNVNGKYTSIPHKPFSEISEYSELETIRVLIQKTNRAHINEAYFFMNQEMVHEITRLIDFMKKDWSYEACHGLSGSGGHQLKFIIDDKLELVDSYLNYKKFHEWKNWGKLSYLSIFFAKK